MDPVGVLELEMHVVADSRLAEYGQSIPAAQLVSQPWLVEPDQRDLAGLILEGCLEDSDSPNRRGLRVGGNEDSLEGDRSTDVIFDLADRDAPASLLPAKRQVSDQIADRRETGGLEQCGASGADTG